MPTITATPTTGAGKGYEWGYSFLFRQRGARTPLSLSKSSMELTNHKPSDTVDVTTDDETTWATSI